VGRLGRQAVADKPADERRARPYEKLVACMVNNVDAQTELDVFRLLNALAHSATPAQRGELLIHLDTGGATMLVWP
jgi:hypothetical protein